MCVLTAVLLVYLDFSGYVQPIFITLRLWIERKRLYIHIAITKFVGQLHNVYTHKHTVYTYINHNIHGIYNILVGKMYR